ncbi:PREDICTED: serine palmitoyltransferase small subunit A [Chaetura pelagica]|uniref:serine palmitoyltransferase small subunit A n=1 Tax=Chaetura pelagica TaxID=8897 RepID=UPI000523CA4C|nr:PREDICTED: serine palmitoyltransferase small subunit A [Chaetura pelagica]
MSATTLACNLRSAKLVFVLKLDPLVPGPGQLGAVRTQRGGLGANDSMLVSIVGMALYTGYVFMPQHIMAILHYFEIVQ